MSRHERILVDGPDGKIEVFVEGHENPRGIVLVAHPHPLFGGTADNKVVTTLARAFRERGCITLRPSFRGSAPKAVGARLKILDCVDSWAWVSKPMTTS